MGCSDSRDSAATTDDNVVDKNKIEPNVLSRSGNFIDGPDKLNKEIILKAQKLTKLYEEFQEEKKKFEKYKTEVIDKYLKAKEQEKTILIGLNDLDATCYMNATLECFSNVKELTEYFLSKYSYNPNDKTKKISNAYYEVIKNLWNKENNNGSYSPSTLKETLSEENPLFTGHITNDSKNLISFLIGRLHTELNRSNSENDNNNINYENDQLNELKTFELFLQNYIANYNSIISQLFYGIYEIRSLCHECKKMKYNFQIYSFLEFPLEKINQYFNEIRKQTLNNQDVSNPVIDIYECFEYYKKIDLMNGDNKMFCDICGKLNDAYYATSLYSAPKILILNLNRGKGGIYACNVIFPEELNIIDYVGYKDGPTNFELFAVIVNYGNCKIGGHFVAFCKNRMDNNWYLYDDAKVTKCNGPKEYLKGLPYILFYRKK